MLVLTAGIFLIFYTHSYAPLPRSDWPRGATRNRIKCEHTISRVKKYNAVAALYRNHIEDLRRL